MIGSSGFTTSDYNTRYVIELWAENNCLRKEYCSSIEHAYNAIVSAQDHPSMEGSPELYYKLFDKITNTYISESYDISV